ncbi:MAG: carboxypeptidase regulatory-like domain-containing protein [Acidobacteriota bacterium]
MTRRGAVLILLWFSIGISVLPAAARFDAGDVVGAVSDADGKHLVEAVVTLHRGEDAWEVVTDEKGLFQFRDLKPGSYTIRVEREGYSEAIYEPVNIRLGRITTVQVQMSASVEETIVVTSEPPTTVALPTNGRAVVGGAELETIPVSNDPWSVGARAAGVLTDRANAVDGSASTFVAPGADDGQTTYALDGADVTDRGRSGKPVTALGLSSATAIEVTTGGSDISHSTPGAHINLLTRQGSNDAQASARALVTDGGWQASSNRVLVEDLGLGYQRILDVTEAGVDASGRLVRDHLWGWATYETQDIRRQTINGTVENTDASNAAVKLNGQGGPVSGVLAYHRGDYSLSGEDAGPDRSVETTLLESQPSEVLRLENSYLPTANLHFTVRYAQVDSGTARVPLGGLGEEIVLGSDGIWRGSFGEYLYGQDSQSWLLDGATYRSRGSAGHEVRFGFSDFQANHSTAERWGRDGLLHLAGENFGTPFDIIRLERPTELDVQQSRLALWVQDSITFDQLTLELGVRHDIQRGSNVGGRVGSNPLFPELLPEVEFDGGIGAPIEWKSVSPRLALAYAIGGEGRSILRASYSMFASQLYADLVSRVSPAAAADVYLGFDDRNRDDRFDLTEPHFLLAYNGVDPQARFGGSPHRTARLLDPERTEELRLSFEHSLRSGVELGIEHVSREVSGILETRRLIRDAFGQIRPARAFDYQLETVYSGILPDGSPFSAPVYGLREGVELTGGNLLLNGDREQSYQATTLRLTRHLAGQWLLRGHVTFSDWRWRLGGEFSDFDDPTNLVAADSDDASISLADTNGDIVAPYTASERLFLNSRWAFNIFALYQVAPRQSWGFDVAANLRGREGFPLPYSVAILEENGLREVQATERTDSFRLDDVVLLDLRLEKELRFGKLRSAVSLDVFNVLNSDQVLERERQLTSPLADLPRETLSPRALRLGFRLILD